MNTQKQERNRSAVIYTRTAEIDTGEEIHSQQLVKCKASVRDVSEMLEADVHIKTHFSDNGFSSADDYRPGLYSLFDLVAERGVDFVVVSDCERITRSTSTFWEILNYFSENQVELIVSDSSSIGVKVCSCVSKQEDSR